MPSLPSLPGVEGGPVAAAPTGELLLIPRLVDGDVVEYLIDLVRRRVVRLDSAAHYLWSGDGSMLCGTRTAMSAAATDVFTLDPTTLREAHVATLAASPLVNFYGLIGCEPAAGRIVVAQFGYGSPFLPTLAAVVLDLRGQLVHRFDYSDDSGQVFLRVAPDCSVLAENWVDPNRPTTVRRLNDGDAVATISERHVEELSFDGTLVITAPSAATARPTVDVRVLRGGVLWSAAGALQGSAAGPSSSEIAVEVGTTTTGSQVVLVEPGQRLVLLPRATSLHLPNV